MPQFDLIGFYFPLTIALIYAPKAIYQFNYKVPLYFAFTGLLIYAFPIWGPNGIGFYPFHLLYVLKYLWDGIVNKSKIFPALLPFSTMLTFSFLSLAVPDIFRSWEGGGDEWTVGGAGWEDGLIKFWLFPVLILAPVFIGLEWVRSRDEKRPFYFCVWVNFHLSPCWFPNVSR